MTRRFYLKIYREKEKNEVLVAICDEELLGKEFREGNLRLEVSRDFFGGDLVDERRAVFEMKRATILNLVGSRIISLAIREGLIDPDKVITIEGIPHAQMVIIK